jgi:hypothetical protein
MFRLTWPPPEAHINSTDNRTTPEYDSRATEGSCQHSLGATDRRLGAHDHARQPAEAAAQIIQS